MLTRTLGFSRNLVSTSSRQNSVLLRAPTPQRLKFGCFPSASTVLNYQAEVSPLPTLPSRRFVTSRTAKDRKERPKNSSKNKFVKPDLPEPIEFIPTDMGSEKLMVSHDLDCGPFFLDTSTKEELEFFIAHLPFCPLLISGTIKSGKSTLLEMVVPRMVTSLYNKGHLEQYPVFLHCSFKPNSRPSAALQDLADAARKLSKEMKLPTYSSECTLVLPHLAEELKKRGCELWVLLDGFQEPLSQCSSNDVVAKTYTSFFKKIHEDCQFRGGARFVLTGGDMLGLLLASQGNILVWTMPKVISWGFEYKSDVFSAMFDQMISHKRFSPILEKKFPDAKQAILDFFVSKAQEGVGSLRPGLLGLFFDTLLGATETEGLQTALEKSWQQVESKLYEGVSLAVALKFMDAGDCKRLFETANGQWTSEYLHAAFLSFYLHIESLLEQTTSDDEVLRLQAPYQNLVKACAEKLAPFVEQVWAAGMRDQVPESLIFLCDNQDDVVDTPACAHLNEKIQNILFPPKTSSPLLKTKTSKLPSDTRQVISKSDLIKVDFVEYMIKGLNTRARNTHDTSPLKHRTDGRSYSEERPNKGDYVTCSVWNLVGPDTSDTLPPNWGLYFLLMVHNYKSEHVMNPLHPELPLYMLEDMACAIENVLVGSLPDKFSLVDGLLVKNPRTHNE